MRFMPPEASLAAFLLSRNIRIFHVCSPMNAVQAANEALRRGISLESRRGFEIESSYGLKLVALRGNIEADARLRGDDIDVRPLEEFSRDAPGVIIDLSKENELVAKERRKLSLQIDLVRGLMRRLRRENKLLIVREPVEARSIYLDPSAEEDLEEIGSYYYILGGIVDKGNRLSGITSKLAVRWNVERRRIALQGSIIGVPNTLVSLTKILIYAFRGVPIDIAILLEMPKREIKKRLMVEKDPKLRGVLERLLELRRDKRSYAEMPMKSLIEFIREALL